MKRNRIMWGIVSLVVLFTGAVSFGTFESLGQKDNPLSKVTPTMTPAPEIRDTRDLSKYGTVHYTEGRENPSSARFSANKRYDNQDWVVKTVNNPRAGGVGRITEDPPPPLFPVDESPLVVIGEIVAVNAFLSNDRGSVYTEFTIRIEELLKSSDPGKADLKNIVADRAGGVVVYPNGQRIMYQDSDHALPRLGSKYLFFLIKNGPSPNYEILTSYDVTGERIHQMEKGTPFDEFKDSGKAIFVETVRSKIANVRNP